MQRSGIKVRSALFAVSQLPGEEDAPTPES